MNLYRDFDSLTDTQVEWLLDFDTVAQLIRFKECYGELWREIALHTIALKNLSRKALNEPRLF